MSADKHEFQGKDIADAIRKACKSLNASQEDLDIEVLNTGSTGIFGLCSQKARLRVSRKGEEATSTAASPDINADRPAELTKDKKPARTGHHAKKDQKNIPSRPKSPVAEPAEISPLIVETIRTDLAEALSLMNCPSELTVSLEGNSVAVQITGDNVDDIIGPEGRTLDSLQYLFRKIISKKFSEKIIFSLDAGDFRAKRLAELKDLALEFAAEVKKSGKTKAIPSLNPSERRAVHVTLQNDRDIRSRSVGEGLYKKILIYRPSKKKKNNRKKAGSQKAGGQKAGSHKATSQKAAPSNREKK